MCETGRTLAGCVITDTDGGVLLARYQMNDLSNAAVVFELPGIVYRDDNPTEALERSLHDEYELNVSVGKLFRSSQFTDPDVTYYYFRGNLLNRHKLDDDHWRYVNFRYSILAVTGLQRYAEQLKRYIQDGEVQLV